ncbi:hypothetical protein A2976_00330 [candidate division WWE3 bacterium RIFCSPLOWO2_01_FULL_41_9]|uniref:Uncharacterized protein n=1 Tax=candidate division WWE3 bacterium RIFCSPLOWO2_01_FULL_41_9 TaxID=1802626 RepID=A0A1F4VM72_UNCKA|nr:MAG: hypothetical protein A2976_00330 [candidate division WWE3 bacterium RIFCSPLOWO2_01_FULL_41_9]
MLIAPYAQFIYFTIKHAKESIVTKSIFAYLADEPASIKNSSVVEAKYYFVWRFWSYERKILKKPCKNRQLEIGVNNCHATTPYIVIVGLYAQTSVL